MADRFAPKPDTRLHVGDCREILPGLQADHHRGPLKFPRSVGAIVRDMERVSSPRQYDELLDEYERHPTIAVTQAEGDAIDALVDEWDAIDALVAEQNGRGIPPLHLTH